MSQGFRKPRTPEEFVSQAKTAEDEPSAAIKILMPGPVLIPPAAVPAPMPFTPAVEAPNPRVMRQVNFDLPEPLHVDLKMMVASMPSMSMRKFIVEAILARMEQVRAGRRT